MINKDGVASDDILTEVDSTIIVQIHVARQYQKLLNLVQKKISCAAIY